MWSSGDGVLLRYVDAGRVSRVLPITVVADDEQATQLFIPTGARTRTRCDLDGTPVSRALPYAERFERPWILGEGTWSGFNTLSLTHAEGKRVIAAVEARAWPFDRDWAQWRPDPEWSTPTFVEGCDEL